MIVRNLDQVHGSDRDVRAATFSSRRLLLRGDGMGFSLHDTVILPGTETPIWYANHVEAVYLLEGEGEIELVDSGEIHHLRPGTLYALDGHERHLLRTERGMRMVCVFNPPLTGAEVHDENGVYPLIEEEDAA